MACAVLAIVSVASAATYHVTINQPSVIKGNEMKAGDYQLNLKDNAVVLMKGRKTAVEIPVKVENVDKKFTSTSIVYSQENGKTSVKEIQLGGTKTKLLFDSGVQVGGGE